MVINVKNELYAFKIINEPCRTTANDIQQCSYPEGKVLTQDHIKVEIEAYFSKMRPLPVMFFKEEHRANIMVVLREQRELL